MLSGLLRTALSQASRSAPRRSAAHIVVYSSAHRCNRLTSRLSIVSSCNVRPSTRSFHSAISLCQDVKSEARTLPSNSSPSTRSLAECKEEDNHLALKFSDDIIAGFHYIWLRDHCPCKECYQPITFQRQLDTHEIPLDLKPSSVSTNDVAIHIEWPDGHTSCYPYDWLYKHRYGQPYECYDVKDIKKHLWNRKEFKEIQDTNLKEILEHDGKLLEFLENLVKYGIVIIDGVEEPYGKNLTRLADRIGHAQRSHYGDVWDITSGIIDFADTAFMSCKLECHNDGTYFNESPGLQLFHCNFHDGEGGENFFVDGFYVADQLKKSHPDAFEFLANTKIPSFYYEKDSYLFKAHDSIIKLDDFSKQIYQIRFNSNDRDVLSCLSFEDVDKFYKASHHLTSLIRQPANELVIKLKPGRAVLLDNWRVFHARNAFTGTRKMDGFYIQRNTFLSKLLSLRDKLSQG